VLKESELCAMNNKACIEIEDRTQCGFRLRAASLAQELLQALGSDLSEVALVPGRGGDPFLAAFRSRTRYRGPRRDVR